MRFWVPATILIALSSPAHADLRITRDHGGYVEEYKAKYQRIRARGERVIIDGICNSACTMVFGIVPMNKICVTPRASLGFHQAYYDKAFTFGVNWYLNRWMKLQMNAIHEELQDNGRTPLLDGGTKFWSTVFRAQLAL